MNNGFDKEELVKTYVGNNYEVIKHGGFSYCCFLFGWIYLFYRKYYALSYILLGLSLVSSVLYAFLVNYTLYMLMMVGLLIFQFLLGKTFKLNYIRDVNEFVDSKLQEGLSYEEVRQLCITKGGVDRKFAIVVVAVFVINMCISKLGFDVLTPSSLKVHYPEEISSGMSDAYDRTYANLQYNYSEASFKYQDSDNICKYAMYKNDKYILGEVDNAVDVSKKYLLDEYEMDVELETNYYSDLEFNTYFDAANNTFYYIYVDENSMNMLTIKNVKDDTGKCTEFKNYIENHFEYK